MREPAPKTIYLKDYTPPPFLISSIDLDVDIRDDHALVRATLEIARNPKAADAGAPLVLDGEEIELVSVALDGRALAPGEYQLGEESLAIATVPRRFTLETVSRIRPQQKRRWRACTPRAPAFSRSARRRVFAASPGSSTGPT